MKLYEFLLRWFKKNGLVLNDNLNKVNQGLTKVGGLHGHTRIELTNVQTGEIEIIEKDNLITNLVQNLFSHDVYGTVDYNKLIPINQLFNGCLLYETDIAEVDPTMTVVPSGAEIVAHAGSTAYVGEDTTAGNLNVPESGEIIRDNHKVGYRWVWDWATSQGNGEINCVSLCPNAVGYRGRNGESLSVGVFTELGQFIGTGSSWILRDSQWLDYENNRAYRFAWDGTAMTFTSYFMPLSSVGLNEVMQDLEVDFTREYTVSNRNRVGGVQIVGDVVYIVNVKSATSISVIKINRANGDMIGEESISYSGTDFHNFDPWGDNSNAHVLSSVYPIVGDYVYIAKNDRMTYYKCSLSNPADVIELPSELTSAYESGREGGAVVLSNGNFWKNDHMVVSDKVVPMPINMSGHEEFFAGGNELGTNSGVYSYRKKSALGKNNINNVYVGYLVDCISTINLLESPVSKTPDKTMKLTYTVTMEE